MSPSYDALLNIHNPSVKYFRVDSLLVSELFCCIAKWLNLRVRVRVRAKVSIRAGARGCTIFMFGSPYLEWAATSFTVQSRTQSEILAFGYGGLSRSNLSPEVKCPPGASYFEVNRVPLGSYLPPIAFAVAICSGQKPEDILNTKDALSPL